MVFSYVHFSPALLLMQQLRTMFHSCQVDLIAEVIVTGVATQGQKYFDNWVLYFTLAYSQDGRSWNDYTGVDAAKQVD